MLVRAVNKVPVCNLRGALTSRPYNTAFQGRPWELRSIKTIDILDSLNCFIELNVRGGDVIRVLPSVPANPFGGDWISDRIRYAAESLRAQRLDTPFVVTNENPRVHCYTTVSWRQLFNAFGLFNLFTTGIAYSRFTGLVLNKPFSIFYLTVFDKASIPFDLLAWFWVDRLYDFFSINPAATQQIAVGTTRLFARNDCTLGGPCQSFKRYSNIFVVTPELSTVLPVFWSHLNQLSTNLSTSIFSFGSISPIKFNACQKTFKHVGTLRDFKLLVDGNHWLSTLIKPNSNKRTLFLLLVTSPGSRRLFEYLLRLTHLGFLGNVDTFPVYKTNAGPHSSLFGLPSESVDVLSTPTTKFLFESSVLFTGAPGFSQNLEYLNELRRAPTISVASNPTTAMQHSRVVLPASTYIEKRHGYTSIFGNTYWSHTALPPPGLSVSPSLVFMLLYARFARNLQVKNLPSLLTSLFIHTAIGLTNSSHSTTIWHLLHRLVKFGLSALLNLPTFLHEIATPGFIEFQLRADQQNLTLFSHRTGLQFFVDRVSTTLLSEPQSAWFLGFEDELTSFSTSLDWTQVLLTKNYGTFSETTQ